MKYCTYFLFCFLLFSSCSKDEVFDQKAQCDKETVLIENYLKENNLIAEKVEDGLYYIIETPGNNEKPSVNNTVKTNYTGYFLDKKVFDSGSNVEFGLFEVIEGWKLGIPKFGKGGKGKLIFTSCFGYGTSGIGPILPNTPLGFDIELIDWR